MPGYVGISPNISTTPLQQWGFGQCLPFSWTTLSGDHWRHPIAVMGVVDTFGQGVIMTRRRRNFITELTLPPVDLYLNFEKSRWKNQI